MNQHPSYELFEELGRGVNTVVYRAYDLSLGREVAIKELDEASRRDPRHRERFLREAQFLAQFEHDNVLRVYSVDAERGWIIMELMKGTLASIISDGPSDPDLVRSILKQTLDALAFLHEKNKVHGTVRPTNLLINEAGRVKLSEFEQTDAGGELRAPKGSKKYLAPELIRPEFGDFGPPIDLYCLGFTALELLKGPQFEGLFPGTGKGAIDADIAWLRWHSSNDELASTKKLVKGIPDDLANVLDRMLKKRVADRPQSAQEVLKELADRPLVAVPIAGVTDESMSAGDDNRLLAPAVVRTISAPPSPVLPRGNSPAVNVDDLATSGSRAKKKTKTSGGAAKSAAKPFSKDWFNQKLGRPYVLYSLCLLMLLGFGWLSLQLASDSKPAPEVAKVEPKPEIKPEPKPEVKPVAPALIPVTFNVEPNAAGLEVLESEKPLAAKDGKYELQPGRHALTLRKEGFQPLARDFDISAESNTFAVKLEPVIKYNDVVVSVTPADAQLTVGGTSQTLAQGAYSQKLQDGKPLAIEVRRDGYVSLARNFSAEELAKLGNKISIELERDKPRLPASLVAKPGAPLDPDVQLPVRALAASFADQEPLELALVKPGTYNFGASDEDRLTGELTARSVRIEQPFYIAIHETTNAQYQRFFEAAGEAKAGTRWQRASRKWATPLNLDPIKNHLPATNVSADEAQAFCDWLGGRLPTEIEWESAVRGPQDRGFPLPWGSGEPNRDRCQIFYGTLGPVPVEKLSAGAAPLGLMNVVGNAAEWCQDSEQPGGFVLRGCSFATANVDHVRITWRARGEARGEEDNGFRVVIPVTLDSPPSPPTAAIPPAIAQVNVVAPSSSASQTDASTTADEEAAEIPGGGPSPLTPIWVLSKLPWKSMIEDRKESE